MRIVTLLLVALAAIALDRSCNQPASAAKPEVEESPHLEALHLVLKQHADKIRLADDPKEWQFDVKPRTFTIARPFYRGYIDTTHWFHVDYEIDGKKAETWTVDTRKGTAKRSEPTDWGKEKK
jgi:hypothetical protein